MINIGTKYPQNSNSLGVLGYLIVVNKQVHNYQLDVLSEYLSLFETKIEDTILEKIINGTDEAVSFSSALEAYSREDVVVQSELLYMMYAIAYVDNSLDTAEKDIIQIVISKSHIDITGLEVIRESALENAKKIRTDNNQIFSRNTIENKHSVVYIFFSRIIIFFKKLFHIKNTPKSDNEMYKNTILECANIAKEDFLIIKPVYEKVLDSCKKTIDEIELQKRSLSLETGISAEVANMIGIFIDKLNSDVHEQTNNAKQSLEQKERTVSDFTISLLGRTKAGKSTLHAILTNQGKKSIGAGKQRTTRYNRVYQWNLLRIIDTPGIGSSEAEGRTDDEIAASVLGESDIICFIIVDDSILKDILEFIERISKLNKPIIILLNHKENIIPDVKFNRYISNPKEWLETKGESNLEGHMNRIYKYAEEKGFASLIKIYPVFLLPALMANETQYSQYSDLLWKNSNIDSFIESLKNWITNGALIKRSQTIIDEAIIGFTQSDINIHKAEEFLNEQIEKLEKRRSEKMQKLRNSSSDVLERIKKVLENEYEDLGGKHALNFAELYYDNNGDLSNLWKNYLSSIDFETNLKNEITLHLMSFKSLVEDVISELLEDLVFSVKLSFEIKGINLDIDFDFKTITRLLGGALGVAGGIILFIANTNPVGWVLTIGGAVISLISNLFKSKEKRRQEKIDTLYSEIHDKVINSKEEDINRVLNDIKSNLDSVIEQVDSIFEDLLSGLSKVTGLSEGLRKTYENEINWLNKVYGWRIVQFLRKSKEVFSENVVDRTILDVDRKEKGIIKITLSEKMNQSTDVLDDIISEKVIIEGIK